MKIFRDSELKQEIDGSVLHGGIVDAGESKIFEFYVQNDSSAILQNIKFSIDDSEVEIVESPEELRPFEAKKLIIKATADINIEQRIDARIKIAVEKLWE